MSIIRAQRAFTLSWSRAIQRESPDKTPEKQKPTPRFQKTPSTAAMHVKGVETTVLHRMVEAQAVVKPQCPWCKVTKVDFNKNAAKAPIGLLKWVFPECD